MCNSAYSDVGGNWHDGHMKSTYKIFGLLILTILIQETINRTLDKYFVVGIAPTLIFGTIWNLKNGQFIYSKLSDKEKFSLKFFKVFSIATVIWLVVYTYFLNIFIWPHGTIDISSGRLIFNAVSGLFVIYFLFVFYFNISFVTRGLNKLYDVKGFGLKTVLSIIFFPLGLLWLQPKIEGLK